MSSKQLGKLDPLFMYAKIQNKLHWARYWYHRDLCRISEPLPYTGISLGQTRFREIQIKLIEAKLRTYAWAM